ncbi:hypothetical protein U1Q18_051472 [Sarracenia purpurea var. burkii]
MSGGATTAAAASKWLSGYYYVVRCECRRRFATRDACVFVRRYLSRAYRGRSFILRFTFGGGGGGGDGGGCRRTASRRVPSHLVLCVWRWQRQSGSVTPRCSVYTYVCREAVCSVHISTTTVRLADDVIVIAIATATATATYPYR